MEDKKQCQEQSSGEYKTFRRAERRLRKSTTQGGDQEGATRKIHQRKRLFQG